MKKKAERKSESPQQVTPEESLNRMRSFTARKESFVAAIKKSKDRNIPAGARS
jgi:hypothetical protein